MGKSGKISVKKQEAVKNMDMLFGKKWVACGDSFTHGDFSGLKDPAEYTISSGRYEGKFKVYPFLIGERAGMEVINEAVNGSTMTNLKNCETHNFSFSRYRADILDDADYITLAFGINDCTSHQNAPIGTIDDKETSTFYGAWNVTLRHLIYAHPYTKIGIIITNGFDGLPEDRQYPEAIRRIARKYGLPYLDMDSGEQVPMMNRNNRKDVDEDIRLLRNRMFAVEYGKNHHPNPKAHEYESTFIESFLRTL